MTRREPRLLRFHCGPDWMRGEGWSATLTIVSRPDLMGAGEEGRYILAGLEIMVHVRWPHNRAWRGTSNGWRSPLKVWCRSDAAEIASRNAGEAGQVDALTFAVVDGPPRWWMEVLVRDLDTGELVDGVVEVDVAAGYVRRHARDADGFIVDGDRFRMETLRGRFAIERATP